MIINKVNIFLYNINFLRAFRRYTHSDKTLHPLESRKLLQVSGCESSTFLQGLITNDMKHFEEGAKSIYAMFLNNKGRVLYETLIHKHADIDTFLIECDKNIMSMLQKHLKMFKLRRNINIDDINNELKIWALTAPLDSIVNMKETNYEELSIYKDPRLINLGYRIIAPSSLEGLQVAKKFGQNTLVQNNDAEYKYLRYQFGVSEGVGDVPPGSSFPLEANCDYLHGVSFHKGCYIGQEVTARVHHTGVVRKRLMPLKFNENLTDTIDADSVISLSKNLKSNVGKLKGLIRDYGLGLVRIKECLEAESLTVGNHTAKVIKPSWWPVEAPKEKIKVSKTD